MPFYLLTHSSFNQNKTSETTDLNVYNKFDMNRRWKIHSSLSIHSTHENNTGHHHVYQLQSSPLKLRPYVGIEMCVLLLLLFILLTYLTDIQSLS